jgi:hypothetical protein
MSANKAKLLRFAIFTVTVLYIFYGRQPLLARKDFTEATFITIDCLKSCSQEH